MPGRVVRALFTSHISETVQLHEGELWAADDAVVVAHPDWFSDDLLTAARRTGPPPAAVVEQDDIAEPEAPVDEVEPEPVQKTAKRRYRTADEKVDE